MRDDAISLKEFTIHMAVDRVRLCKPPEEHDGQVEINGQVFDVQITQRTAVGPLPTNIGQVRHD